MIGSEHKKERISERLQGLNNQPRRRGYLPGCHMRAMDMEGHAAYGIKTLQGNWAEERCDAGYTDDKPVIPTDLEKAWRSTYTIMAEQGTQNAVLRPPNAVTQVELIDVIDGRQQCYPGHQAVRDPGYKEALATAHDTTYRTSFRPPREVRQRERQYVPPVLGGSPDAQPRAVLLRIRHRLLHSHGPDGQGAGNFAALRRALRAADTTGCPAISLNGRELRAGLASYNIPLEEAEVTVLVKFFDKDGSGEIPVEAFCRHLRGDMVDRRLDLVKKAYRLLNGVTGGVVRLGDIFRLYDVSNHPDVKNGVRTAEQELHSFKSQWDVPGNDRGPEWVNEGEVIEQDQFINYYADVSAAISNDQAFELIMRNTWHISGGEGICRNSSCRRVLVTHTTGRQTMQEIRNDLGIGPRDLDKMRENLAGQGITDVARIQLI